MFFILIHDVVSLPDAKSCDKQYFFKQIAFYLRGAQNNQSNQHAKPKSSKINDKTRFGKSSIDISNF